MSSILKLCFISNLFPRPDQPQRGMFNLQLVEALWKLADVRVIVPVTGIRGKRGEGRGARDEGELSAVRCQMSEVGGRREEVALAGQGSHGERLEARGQRSGGWGSGGEDGGVIFLPVRHFPLIGRNMAAWFHEKALKGVQHEVERADVILASWLYPDGVAAARIGAELGVPVWIMVLGSDIFHLRSRFRRSEILKACSAAKGVICVASHLKDALVNAGANPDTIYVVPNGVNTSLFRPATRDEISNEVLWIGNMVSVKNPKAMIDVWRNMARSDLKLVFIGEGVLSSRLQRLSVKYFMPGQVEFPGSIPQIELAKRLAKATALCLTSRSEGMPNVVLEALASGVPVVASDVGAVPEMLGGRDECRVVERGEGFADRFARAVREVAELKIDRMAMAQKKPIRSWDDMAREILKKMKGWEKMIR